MTDQNRDKMEDGREPGAEGGWQGGDPGRQADEGLIGRGGTGSLGSGGASIPQSDPAETSWQGESGGMSGGAQGQSGVEGDSWEGRDRDIGTGGWTTGDAGFGRTSEDDGGPQSEDPGADPSVNRPPLG